MIRLFMELTKFKLSAAVTLSALFAYILAGGNNLAVLGGALLSVLLLALGVSALNQYQEWESDRMMQRTRQRPIPSGRISPSAALSLATALIAAAMLLIFLLLGNTGLLLFLFVPLWYNGVYTSLKRHTAFAVVPGGLLGVIPPAIGWLAAGRGLSEPEFLALGLLFFVWQVPHFWLLSAKYDTDYRAAGFPTALEAFGPVGFRHVLFVWWVLTISCSIYTAVVFGMEYPMFLLMWVLIATALIAAIPLLHRPLNTLLAGKLFRRINLFLLTTLTLLSLPPL